MSNPDVIEIHSDEEDTHILTFNGEEIIGGLENGEVSNDHIVITGIHRTRRRSESDDERNVRIRLDDTIHLEDDGIDRTNGSGGINNGIETFNGILDRENRNTFDGNTTNNINNNRDEDDDLQIVAERNVGTTENPLFVDDTGPDPVLNDEYNSNFNDGDSEYDEEDDDEVHDEGLEVLHFFGTDNHEHTHFIPHGQIHSHSHTNSNNNNNPNSHYHSHGNGEGRIDDGDNSRYGIQLMAFDNPRFRRHLLERFDGLSGVSTFERMLRGLGFRSSPTNTGRTTGTTGGGERTGTTTSGTTGRGTPHRRGRNNFSPIVGDFGSSSDDPDYDERTGYFPETPMYDMFGFNNHYGRFQDESAESTANIMERIEQDNERIMDRKLKNENLYNRTIVRQKRESIKREIPGYTSKVKSENNIGCELCGITLGEGIPKDFKEDVNYDKKLEKYRKDSNCLAPWFVFKQLTDVDRELSKRVFLSKCGHLYCGRCIKNIGNRPRTKKGRRDELTIDNPKIFAPKECVAVECGTGFRGKKTFTELYF